jgi:hypothetical protein
LRFLGKAKKVKNEHERGWSGALETRNLHFQRFSRGVMNGLALKSSRNGDEKEGKMGHQFVIHFLAESC